MTFKNPAEFSMRRVGQRFITHLAAKLVWLMADMQLVAKWGMRRVFCKQAVILNDDSCGAIPPIVLRIRIEKRNGTVGRQGEAMLHKRACGCNGAQNSRFAGCVWPINADDQRQTLTRDSP